MIDVDERLPALDLVDTTGQPVTLDALAGPSGTLLFFLRSTTCPACDAHIRDLGRHREQYDAAGVRVVVVAPEGVDSAARWKAKRGNGFAVVTGREGSAHAEVGLMTKVFGALQQSGSVLVDHEGVVRHRHGASLPTASYDRRGIEQAITTLAARPVN